MGVSWVTLEGTDSVVRYGMSADLLEETVEGSELTYTQAGWIGERRSTCCLLFACFDMTTRMLKLDVIVVCLLSC